jgi:MFS family permease
MSATTPEASLRRDATVISLVGFAHGTSHFFHFMLPPLFPWLMAEFNLGFTQVGITMTIFFVVSGTGQALSGFVVDRIGALRVLCGGIGLLTLSGLVLSLAGGFPMVLAAAFIAGLGNCVFHPADFTLLNRRVSTPRLGHAFSVHGLSGTLGWAAGPVVMATIATAAGWRAAGLGAAVVGLIALSVLFVNRRTFQDALPQPHAAAQEASGGTFDFLRSATVWTCFVFFSLITLAFGALQNFAPSIFERLYGVSIAVAATGLTAFLLASAAGTALGGFAASRGETQDRVVGLGFGLAAIAAALLASASLPASAIPAMMSVMGFCIGFANPSRDMLVRRAATTAFGTQAYGRVYGFVYSGIDVGLAASPLLFGPLMDQGRFSDVLWGVAILQVVVIATAVTVGTRSRSR